MNEIKTDKKEHTLTSRDLKAIERKEELLGAAKELFALQGYHATTTRQITKQIGMAEGLIYHYFPKGKQEMLDLILKDFLEDRYILVESEIKELDETLPIESFLLALGNIIFTYIAKDKNVLLILLKEKSSISEEYIDSYNHHVNILMKQTIERLQKYVDKKEIYSFDQFYMMNQFWSAIYSYIIQDVFFENHKMYACDQDTYLKKIVDYTLLTWKVS